RRSFLDESCGGDAALRADVDALLEASDQAGNFLESPAEGLPLLEAGPDADEIAIEEPGTQIGPYKLIAEIGEGGFGMVFLYEQHQSIRRQVALKILKPGMDTRQVVARFEAERQALALMDHPNIAKVLDAGTVGASRMPGSERVGTRIPSGEHHSPAT